MEVGAVNFIHGAEIPQILHKYCRLDDIVQRQTGLLQHSLQILERLVRLGLHALGQCTGGGVQAELAAERQNKANRDKTPGSLGGDTADDNAGLISKYWDEAD